MNTVIIGGSVSDEGGECSCIVGSVTYCYNGDYTADTDAACDSAKGKLDGTLVDATASTSYVDVDISAIGDNYLRHTIDSSELSGGATGTNTIWLSFFLGNDGDADVEQTQIAEIGLDTWDSNNYIQINVQSDGSGPGQTVVTQYANGTAYSVYTAINATDDDTWYRLGYSWDADEAGNDHALYQVACGGSTQADCAGDGDWTTPTDEDDDDLDALTQPDRVWHGQLNTTSTLNEDLRVADVYFLSGYKTADPF